MTRRSTEALVLITSLAALVALGTDAAAKDLKGSRQYFTDPVLL